MLKRIEHQDESICRLETVKDYVRKHEPHMDFMYNPFIKDMQRLNVGGRCLEIGAGPGLFTSLFAAHFPAATITVTDISSTMMVTAKNLIKEKGMEQRAEFHLCDVRDADILKRLGKFDFVFSIYSMHHWQNLSKSIHNLFDSLADSGTLYLGDLKRVWWLYYLPTHNRDIQQIRAAYLPRELKHILQKMGIRHYEIRTLFPYFLMSVVASAGHN